MKILFTLIITFAFYFHSSSQIKYTFTGAIAASAKATPTIQKNKWYKFTIPGGIVYMYYFNENPIGIKKALELTKDICDKNDLNFEEPDSENSYIASYVETINDFEKLDLSISTGGSIIEKSWVKLYNNSQSSMLSLELEEGKYIVAVTYLK